MEKYINPDAVQFLPDLAQFYTIDSANLKNIAADMKKNGYDDLYPLLLARIKGIPGLYAADGHTRIKAAKLAGIIRIPYRIKNFESLQAVKDYIEHIQEDRRNLGDSYRVQKLLSRKKEYDEAPNKKKYIAKLLHIGERTAAKYKKIIDNPKLTKAVIENDESVNAVVKNSAPKKSKIDGIKKRIKSELTPEEFNELYEYMKKEKRRMK